MTKLNISPELDDKLRLSISHQGQFLEDISFVYALQSFDLIVPSKIFYFEIEDHKALPIFTTERDLQEFKDSLNGDSQELTDWELRSIRDILPALLETDIDMVGFNPKFNGHKEDGSTIYFDKTNFMEFIGHYTEILNVMLDEENLDKDRLSRSFLVPVFLWRNDGDESGDVNRGFAAMVTQDDEEYVPVFDSLNSFAVWYNAEYFASAFKENSGQVLMTTLPDLMAEKDAKNVFGKTLGVTINPLDEENQADYKQTLLKWTDIK